MTHKETKKRSANHLKDLATLLFSIAGRIEETPLSEFAIRGLSFIKNGIETNLETLQDIREQETKQHNGTTTH